MSSVIEQLKRIPLPICQMTSSATPNLNYMLDADTVTSCFAFCGIRGPQFHEHCVILQAGSLGPRVIVL